MQEVDENKVYRMAKKVWQEQYRHFMSFDSYYAQIKGVVAAYFSLQTKAEKRMFLKSRQGMINMILNELERVKQR